MKFLSFCVIALVCSAGSLFGQWPQVVGGPGDESARIAADNSGNLYVVGSFQDTLNVGGASLPSPGTDAIYLAKFDANGNHIWSQAFGGNSSTSDGALVIAVDSLGDIVIARSFEGTINLGGDDLTNTSAFFENFFIAKYAADGTHIWSRQYGGVNGSEMTEALTVDSEGNIYLTGFFGDIGNFGGSNFIALDTDLFLAKFDANGEHIWSFGAGDSADEHPFALAVDQSGNVFLTGFFAEPGDHAVTNLGGSIRVSSGYSDIFLVKYSAEGDHIWSREIGGPVTNPPVPEVASGVGVDGENLYLTGIFNDSTDLGGGIIRTTGQSDSDIFVAKYDTAGGFGWARGIGGTANDSALDLTIGATGDLFISGMFRETLLLDDITLQSRGNQDIFVAGLTATGTTLWANGFGGTELDTRARLAYHQNSELSLVFAFSGLVDINGKQFSGFGGRDVLIAKLSSQGNLITAVRETPILPGDFELQQNYPNPFNPETTITFRLPQQSEVKVEIFNVLGQKVRTLLESRREAGTHRVIWDGRAEDGTSVVSGAYFYKASVGNVVQTKRMVLLK